MKIAAAILALILVLLIFQRRTRIPSHLLVWLSHALCPPDRFLCATERAVALTYAQDRWRRFMRGEW